MTHSIERSAWWPLRTDDDPRTPTSPVDRAGPRVFGVVEGTVGLVARAVRDDGRLGAPESLAVCAAGELVVLPPERRGRVIEIRASHDARWHELRASEGGVDALDRLEPAVRPYFPGPAELRAWRESLDPAASWSTIVAGIAGEVDRLADEAIDSAAARLRDRLRRLRTLDDAALDDAVRIMVEAPAHPVATPVSDADRSAEVRAILRVLDTLGIPTGDGARLEPQPGVAPVEHVARALHLQYREVRLDDRWWRDAAGPLLARRSDDGTPVALVPIRGGYAAHEFRDGEVRTIDRVTEATATAYDATAWMFHRPLPAGPVRIADLLRLVAVGNLRDVLLMLGVTVATSALVALAPILTGLIVGSVIPGVERTQLLFVGGMLVSIAISQGLLRVAAGIAFLRLETRSSYQIVAALVDRILQLPAAFFRDGSAGDLTQRVMAVEQVRAAITQSILSVFVSLVASLSNLGVLLYHDATMGLTAIAVIAVELAVVAWIAVRMAQIDYRLSVAKGELDGFGIDLLLGIRQIRVQGSRDRVLARLLGRLGRVGAFGYRAGILGVRLGVVVGATSTIALAFVFVEFTAALRDPTGATVPGAGGFVAFVTALAAFLGAVVGVAPAIQSVASVVPQFRRLRPILEASTEASRTGGDAITLRGGVAARGIEFRYDPEGPPVLSGVDIEARPGEFVAIIGRTGCGKSTLLSVLLGLETPDAGQVLYDDVPFDNLDPAIVRGQIGVVMQSNQVLGGTIRSTILGVGSRRTVDDAWAAARLVGLADEIDRLPMGMLTMVTPNAIPQSHLQRLLIARALVNRPEILFLDEATSTLDNASQAEITRTIDELGSTRIVIAHRLATIRRADRIYVLDRGRVVQVGTFDELAAEGGVFRELMGGDAS